MIENCSTSVGSNCCIVYDDDDETLPWKEYRKYKNNPDAAFWSITPDTSLQPYWKWIICRFQSEIEKKYGKKFAGRGEIPEAWNSITKEDAIKSLSSH